MRFLILFILFLLFSVSLGFNINLSISRSRLYAEDIFPETDLSRQARTLYNGAKFNEAINVYQEIIRNNPEDLKAYLNLAYIYKDLADYKPAIRILKEVAQHWDDLGPRKLLAQLYYLSAKPQEAINYFKPLLSSSPKDPELLFYLGLCYEGLGRFSAAEDYYRKAIKFAPNHMLAYLKLGDIYYQKQRPKDASRIYEKIISYDPSIPNVRQRLAECYVKLGKLPEAYQQYAKCIAISPDDELLREDLKQLKQKLGKDFFKQKEVSTDEQRRKKLPRVKPSISAARAYEVKVGIVKVKDSVKFKCGSDFTIIDKQSNDSLFEGGKEVIYLLAFNKENGKIQLRDQEGNMLLVDLVNPFLIKNKSEGYVISIFDIPLGEGNFWAGWYDQQYRGMIEVIPQDDHSLQLLNLVNLEEYLYGVLPSEMPANWPQQSLEAQAIAARTWALRNKTRHNHEGFNFCNTVHCQVYKGVTTETLATNKAVDDTAGIMLTVNNQLIDIFYSNNCGGFTRNGVSDSLSLDFKFPLSPLQLEDWLKGEPEAFCNLAASKSASFRWMRLYKHKELQAMLSESGVDLGEIISIIPQERSDSGHLISIAIKGVDDTQIIKGENSIRKIFGNLRSSAFKIEVKYNQQNQPEEFIFYGGGFGHARGLCQLGVKGMALKGYNYLEILRHYYPGVEIKKVY
ncbi:MAG: SpoIID/LytB domain-containing protein [Candidatus Omnitrophota bacterium]